MHHYWIVGVLLLGAACGSTAVSNGTDGGSANEYSCDFRSGAMSLYTCRDFQGLADMSQLQSFESNCSDPNQHGGVAGIWSSGPCSTAGALGGCRTISSGVTITIWSFPGSGATTSSIMASCAAGSGMFVTP
jgi:hypothetical protein